MKRRNFLKGAALVSMSPFLPDLKPLIKFAEFVKNGDPVNWADGSNCDPLADIQAAMERVRANTVHQPDRYMLRYDGVLYSGGID